VIVLDATIAMQMAMGTMLQVSFTLHLQALKF